MAENTPPASSAARIPFRGLGRIAFGLGLASVLVYFATSEGIHNFVAFLLETAAKVMGHRA